MSVPSSKQGGMPLTGASLKRPACLSFPISQKTPEQLVGLGFRYWMSGYQQNDFQFWTSSWDFYTKELGAPAARSVVTDLASWVQEIHSSAGRPIKIAAKKAPHFCRDECMAVSLIAACQNNVCPALKACAQALIGDQDIESVIAASEGFAFKLADYDIRLGGLEPGETSSFTMLNDNSPAY